MTYFQVKHICGYCVVACHENNYERLGPKQLVKQFNAKFRADSFEAILTLLPLVSVFKYQNLAN